MNIALNMINVFEKRMITSRVDLDMSLKFSTANVNNLAYFKSEIKKDNYNAMREVGNYYQSISDYDKMVKYYIMAIEKGDADAMHKLAHYYQFIKIDYEKMIKYYLMAIEKKLAKSMYNLAQYYYLVKDYENMIKYYLMAIDLGLCSAMHNLALYYLKIKDYAMMMIYALKLINMNNFRLVSYIIDYYVSNNNHEKALEYYWLALVEGVENIPQKFINYLKRYKIKRNNMIEIYVICYKYGKYDNTILEKIASILNVNSVQIFKYIEKRCLKINKLILEHVKCAELCDIICDYEC
jgi:TPR repeat protein